MWCRGIECGRDPGCDEGLSGAESLEATRDRVGGETLVKRYLRLKATATIKG